MKRQPKPVLVLMKDHEAEASDAVAVSEDVEQLVSHAIPEDFCTNMAPLRDIGTSVPIGHEGDELRIEESPLL